MEYKVTVFKSIRNTSTPFHVGVDDVIERIRSGNSKPLIDGIRKEKDKAKRNDLKMELPSICFSGVFTKRQDDKITEHSGLICLDFDGYERKKDMQEDRDMFIEDAHTFAVFTSPSGNGLKVLVKIPKEIDNHHKYFNALRSYYSSQYFDPTSKNISRVCYESYDPNIHVNYDSDIWTEKEDDDYEERSVTDITIPIRDSSKIADILVKWWEDKYPMVKGSRNHNAYVLARAFNDFGVSKDVAKVVLRQHVDKSFPEYEVNKTIDSAYTHTNSFGSRVYEDDVRIAELKTKLKGGASPKDVKREIEETDGLTSKDAEAVVSRLEEEASKTIFWTISEKGAVRLDHLQFKQFLEEHGFRKFCPDGSKTYVFVKVTNNLIDHTSEQEIKDFVLTYLEDEGDVIVYNHFADKTRYFKDDFLSLLSTIEVHFMEDTTKAGYLYYRNCAVKVSRDSVETIDYIDLDGFVWREQVIDRNFSPLKDDVECDYSKFIRNISGGTEDREVSMRSTIGFLLHGYKDDDDCPAVILNDEVISDNPEGGTGKGLFMKAIGQMRKVVTIDGKAFNFNERFSYQLVSADTQILLFDDVKKHFNFERLFSVITEGITMEKKNKDAIKIPFSKSPKVAITTNYAIKGSGNSFDRRKWELELHQHYNGTRKPRQEFGRMFFSGWDDAEWKRFDNYMIRCIQLFLREGLVKSEFVNLKVRQLSAETSHDFIEWCGLLDNGVERHDSLTTGVKFYKHELYDNFVSEYPDYAPKAKMTISRNQFYKWLVAYALFAYGVSPTEGRDREGRYMVLREKHEYDEQQKLKL